MMILGFQVSVKQCSSIYWSGFTSNMATSFSGMSGTQNMRRFLWISVMPMVFIWVVVKSQSRSEQYRTCIGSLLSRKVGLPLARLSAVLSDNRDLPAYGPPAMMVTWFSYRKLWTTGVSVPKSPSKRIELEFGIDAPVDCSFVVVTGEGGIGCGELSRGLLFDCCLMIIWGL